MNRAFGLSLAAHALLALWLWQDPQFNFGTNKNETANAMQTRTISEGELQKLVRKNQQTQVVQSEDSIKTDKFIPNLNEKTFLAKQNQYVDRNTRAPKWATTKTF